MSRRPRQLAMKLKYRGRGGPREGAGRPRKPGGRVSHDARPSLSRHHPVHVTLRAVPRVPNLRRIQIFRRIADAFHQSRERFGFRVTHCSVQANHIHLIAEAEDRASLVRGTKGLKVRIARGVNGVLGRKGPVFAERYHEHVLKTPREVAHAIKYVRQLVQARRPRIRGLGLRQAFVRVRLVDGGTGADVAPTRRMGSSVRFTSRRLMGASLAGARADR